MFVRAKDFVSIYRDTLLHTRSLCSCEEKMKNRKAVWQAKRLQIKSMLFGGIIYIYKEQIVILDEAEKGIK